MLNDKEIFILIVSENGKRIKYSESWRHVSDFMCTRLFSLTFLTKWCGCYFWRSFSFCVYGRWTTLEVRIQFMCLFEFMIYYNYADNDDDTGQTCRMLSYRFYSVCLWDDNAKCHTCYHKIQNPMKGVSRTLHNIIQMERHSRYKSFDSFDILFSFLTLIHALIQLTYYIEIFISVCPSSRLSLNGRNK